MSFRLQTILGIALIESVLLLILIFNGMNFLSESNASHLKQRAETTALLFSKAVKNALISNDYAALEGFISDVLTLPDIRYARISNDDFILAQGGEALLLEKAHLPDKALSDVTDGIFDVAINIEEGKTAFGKIEIGFSTAPIETTLANAQRWAIAIASLEVVLVTLFSFMLGTYLTQQLQQLKNATDTIKKSGPGHQIKVFGKGEIANVIQAFNSMSSSLAKSYEQLSKSIAAEKEMSALAQRNEAQNKAILTASLDALITIDQDGRVIDYNEMAESTFGWTHAELIGQNLAEHIIPQHKRNAHHAGMKNFLLTKTSPVINQRLELTALHKAGHTFPIEINIAPIETEQGIFFTAFIRDITSRLETETELRLAAQTFKSSEAMFISDEQGNIIRINQSFTEITGYEDQDIIGQKPSILSSGQHPPAYFEKMWSTLSAEGKWNGEIYNKRKNGDVYPEYLNISSVKDNDGKTTHYIAHFLDISEQKNNEEKLRKARLAAEASNESKSRFLASMSHEIRTPMSVILGILDLLTDTTLTDEQLTLISTARDSGELLMTIINDILDFTKMDVNEQVLQLNEFDLPHLLRNCITLLQHVADKKSLHLVLELSDDLPQFVKGDADRLQQIFINLINNAIKFTDTGSVRLTASLDNVVDNSLMLRFQVIDTGVGIHPNNHAALFDEFTMVDQTHSRKYEGTGLGLAICRRLIYLMKGSINVMSELGSGSTFVFTIELKSADEKNISPVLDHSQPLLPSPNTRILLAEDNIANQMVIRSILEHAALQVDVVNNGKEVMQSLKHTDYDIILMDISMPEMDGMAATEAIRKLAPPLCDLPIIAMTAHTLSGDKERFLKAGMNDYISKPINRATTLTCIAHWTQQSPDKHQIASAPKDEQPPAQLVDEQVLQQLVTDTDPSIVPELIHFYIKDSRQRIHNIQLAITEDDVTRLEFETHTVGSSAVAHGNAKLYVLARKVELLCREGNKKQAMADAQTLLAVAEESFSLLAIRAQQGFTAT